MIEIANVLDLELKKVVPEAMGVEDDEDEDVDDDIDGIEDDEDDEDEEA